MAKRNKQVEVEGLIKMQKALRKAGQKDVVKEVRKANKDSADIVARESKVQVPVSTGKLQKSIGSLAREGAGYVKAGTPKGVRYSGPIHFGWPAKGISPQPFIYEAIDSRIDEVRETYDRLLRAAMKNVTR